MIPLILGLLMLALPVQSEPTLEQLSNIHLDKTQIYSVRDISLNRDVFSISLNRGTIAFTEGLGGHVTGAVFVGSGDILAITPDPVEKQQLFRYTKSALLNEHFESAVFRFTDGTYEEILKQYRSHAQEQPDPADVEEVLRWESELQRRAAYLNDRILADLIGTRRPFFLAQIEGAHLGWFDAVYDERRVEEVFVQQNTSLAALPIVWMSFHKRSQVRNPADVAHEDKSVFDPVSAGTDGTLRLRLKADGERVLGLPISAAGLTHVTLEDGTVLPFVAGTEDVAVVLPAPTRSGTEIIVKTEYSPETVVPAPRTRSPDALVPAGYRDQWIVEGLAGYAAAVADRTVLEQARQQLLEQSPEGGSYESRGPVSIGFRMAQPRTTLGYATALRNKSLWILHMLRHVIQPDDKDPVFGRFLEDIVMQSRGKSISTYDVMSIAEKHAGKPLDWFFEAWVFGTGVPSYEVSHKVEPSADGFVVSGNITQSGVPDVFEVPVPVYADGSLLGMVTVSNLGGEFRFVVPNKPQQILIDPKDTILTAN